MFGLNDPKKKKPLEPFDIETDMKSPKMRRETIEKIQERIGSIKALLRAGQDKEEYSRFGVVLSAYASLLKVIGRIGATPKES